MKLSLTYKQFSRHYRWRCLEYLTSTLFFSASNKLIGPNSMGAGYDYSYLRWADKLGGGRPVLNKQDDYECHLNSSTKYLLTSSLFICLLFLTILPYVQYKGLSYTNKIIMSNGVQSYKPLSNQQSQPLRPTCFFDSRPGMWTSP